MKKMVMIALIALGVFAFSACSSEDGEYDYVMVDINPSITFIIDEDGIVDSFVLNNEDAEIVAVDLEFIGLDVEDALELYLDAAIEAGYIDVDAENNAIFVTTDKDDEDDEDALNKRIRGRAEQFMQERGIGAAIIRGKIDDELRERAEDLDIGVGRLRLIETAVEIDEALTLEDALELDIRDIMEIVRESHQDRMQTFQEERREAAQSIRDGLRDEVQERVKAHREAVEAGEIELPDYDAIREEFRARAQEKMDDYRERARERRDNMRP